MKNKMNKKVNESTLVLDGKKKGYRFLLIFSSVFLTLVIILGAVLGIVSGVKRSKAAVVYDGATIDEKTASFLASYYKYYYMQALSNLGIENVEDSPGFWNTLSDEGDKTYLELLIESTKEYISHILVASSLFDKYSTLSSSDRKTIKKSVESILEYKANGKINAFNDAVKKYGFDYTSFEKAATLMYKSGYAKTVIYGADGSAVSKNAELANEYFSEYTHVKILFVRTETKYVLDGNGNKIVDENNDYVMQELTKAEKEKKAALVAEIRDYIKGYEQNGAVQMSPELFENYIINHGDGEDELGDGYYFHPNAYFTQTFPVPTVVDAAYALDIDSYCEVEAEDGIFFLYREALTAYAYSSTLSADCFDDFYADAATELFEKSVKLLSEDVKFTDLYANINLMTIPYNFIYIPSF